MVARWNSITVLETPEGVALSQLAEVCFKERQIIMSAISQRCTCTASALSWYRVMESKVASMEAS